MNVRVTDKQLEQWLDTGQPDPNILMDEVVRDCIEFRREYRRLVHIVAQPFEIKNMKNARDFVQRTDAVSACIIAEAMLDHLDFFENNVDPRFEWRVHRAANRLRRFFGRKEVQWHDD